MTLALIPVIVKKSYIAKQWEGDVDKLRGFRCVESFDENTRSTVKWAEATQDVQSAAAINTDKICSVIDLEHYTVILYEAGRRVRSLRTTVRAEVLLKEYIWPLAKRP